MSSVFSGIGNAVGGIVKGVTKVFKAVVKPVLSSGFGQALLLGSAAYLGGAAFGLFDSPFTSINGILTGASPAASAAAEPSVASGLVSAGATGETTTGGLSQAILGSQAGTDSGGFATSLLDDDVLAASDATNAGATNTLATQAAPVVDLGRPASFIDQARFGGSTFGRALGNAGAFFNDQDPLVKAGIIKAAGSAVGSAFTPNNIDLLNQRAKLQRDEDNRLRAIAAQNLSVGNINLGIAPNVTQPLLDANGNPIFPGAGFINSRMMA